MGPEWDPLPLWGQVGDLRLSLVFLYLTRVRLPISPKNYKHTVKQTEQIQLRFSISSFFTSTTMSSIGRGRGRGRGPPSFPCPDHLVSMLKMATLKLRRLCYNLRWPLRRRRPHQSRHDISEPTLGPIRLATFNAAMFSMAPVVPASLQEELDLRCKSANDRPRGILKQPSMAKAKLRVSINLPDNEISVERSKKLSSRQLNPAVGEGASHAWKGKAPASDGPAGGSSSFRGGGSNRSILDVLREVGADIIGLQNVKAEEEKGMRPLSELAEGLGMKYVFAESWAPEYGDAILSKWPIKRWKVQKMLDDRDFRNVLKATIEVPKAGDINFLCTHLDHLDENWRMKQINTILRSTEGPHILAGCLNSLDETDYSSERWADIVKYYEEMGKPTPKVEVMKYLTGKHYLDAKNFAGECEAVVVVVKGQDVQGTCKYGTRVDYILASPNSPYKFVPGSYGVLSSKGTSDHHIVKVDIVISQTDPNNDGHQEKQPKVVKIDSSSSNKGIW